jgi:predicted aminopeptidase
MFRERLQNPAGHSIKQAVLSFLTSFKCRRHWLLALGFVSLLVGVCGCNTVSFYAQAARGQYRILARQEPVQKLMEDPRTVTSLRERFDLVMQLRNFAEKQLLLPVNGHYRKYADLGRPFVVWNVEAAPEFSMEPKGWKYPFVGRLEYRGYFEEKQARKYAASLKQQGYDVHIGGVTAYSTLGWFKDPLLNTFIHDPEPFLAETLFHELGHQLLFASGDKDFNEAYATFIGREGVRRWLRAKGDEATLAKYEEFITQEDQFALLVERTRARLEVLYGDERTEDGKVRATKRKRGVGLEQLKKEKEQIFESMRADYEAMKKSWNSKSTWDGWFSRPLNNAKLNSVAAYYDFVPAFEKLLAINHGKLTEYYAAAERLSHLSRAERHERLRALMATTPESAPSVAGP